jgi:hypothetical protein
MSRLPADRIVRSLRGLWPAALALPLLFSCQGLKSSGVFGDRTELMGTSRVEQLQPADIAVLVVRNQTEQEDLPVDVLRTALHDELVGRLYSPLDLDYVDGNWVESSFRGSVPPDAVLSVTITHWSTGDLMGYGILEIGADLRLFAGGSVSGTPLWAAQVDRKVQVITGNPPFGPLEELARKGTVDYAREALAVLPERDPLAVQR